MAENMSNDTTEMDFKLPPEGSHKWAMCQMVCGRIVVNVDGDVLRWSLGRFQYYSKHGWIQCLENTPAIREPFRLHFEPPAPPDVHELAEAILKIKEAYDSPSFLCSDALESALNLARAVPAKGPTP